MEGNVYDLTYYKIPFISLKDSTQQQIYVDVDFLVYWQHFTWWQNIGHMVLLWTFTSSLNMKHRTSHLPSCLSTSQE